MAHENQSKADDNRRRVFVSQNFPKTDDFRRERAGRIKRNIDALRASIALDWYDRAVLPFASREREELKQHIKWCALELNALLLAFEEADRTEAED